METRTWHGRQNDVIDLWKYPEAFILPYGSTGSGKTECGAGGFVNWSLHFYNKTFGIVAKTRHQTEEKVWPAVSRFCIEYKIPVTKMGAKSYKVGNNRFLLLDGANVAAAARIQGLDLAGVYIDEVNNLHWRVMLELENRVRSVEHGKIVMSANPDNPLSWFQRDYINRADVIGMRIIHLTWDDNPHLPESEKERIRNTSIGAFRLRREHGIAAPLFGLVYSEHTIESAPDESECRAWYLAVDPAETGTTHALLIGDFDEAFYVYDEVVWDGRRNYYKPIYERVRMIADMVGEREIEWAVYDSANPDFGYTLNEVMNVDTYGVKKDDANESVRLLQASLARGELRFDPRCRTVIEELGIVEWDEKKGEEGYDKIAKVPKHGTDALRYWRKLAEAPRENYSRVYHVQ